MSIKLVIFDLAGTTVKDNGAVVNAFTAALKEHGIAITPEQIRDVRGSSKRNALLQIIPDGPDRVDRADVVYSSFREHLVRHYTTGAIEPIRGAEELFRWLREHGIQTALTTGFDRDMTQLILATLKWNEGMVDAVVCSDEVTQGRPAPFLIFKAMERASIVSVHEVANVGDTVLDLQSAHNAGVRRNIGVTSGAHDRSLLESAPNTHLIESIADLPAVLTENLMKKAL